MANSTRVRPDLLSQMPNDLSGRLFTTARLVRLKANQMLFLAGDPGDGCYRVDLGLLKVTVVSPTGGERILAVLGAGAMVGELSMIDGAPRSTSVAAITDAELSFIGRAAFQTFAETHPDVYKHAMVLLARRLRDTNAVVAASSFLSLKGRVARALLSLAQAFGRDVGSGRVLIHQKVSQSDLAAMAGIARENVSRILNEWKRDAVVSRLSSYYCLENKKELERESEF
jgi:CRP/FNR family transcriptional regulator, cyclic AMP receptor protein